jgi:hypothetical protein
MGTTYQAHLAEDAAAVPQMVIEQRPQTQPKPSSERRGAQLLVERRGAQLPVEGKKELRWGRELTFGWGLLHGGVAGPRVSGRTL